MNKWQRWIEGMKNLTPEDILRAQVSGSFGQILGLLFAMIYMWMTGFWFFHVWLFFGLFLQIIMFISTRQKYQALKIMKAQYELEEVKKQM